MPNYQTIYRESLSLSIKILNIFKIAASLPLDSLNPTKTQTITIISHSVQNSDL